MTCYVDCYGCMLSSEEGGVLRIAIGEMSLHLW